MISRTFPYFLLLLFACTFFSGAASADQLFQIVSLDCQFCGKMAEEGADGDIARYAEENEIPMRVAAFGPAIKVTNVHPHPSVELFWAATPHAPEKDLAIAEIFYRSASGRGSFDKETVLDDIAIQAGITKQKVRESLRQEEEIKRRWSRTALIAQKGMALKNRKRLRTPAFAIVSENKVVEYTDWQGSVSATKKSVKSIIDEFSDE